MGATGSIPTAAGEAPAPAAEKSAPGWKAWVAAGAVAAVVAVGAAVVLGGGGGSSNDGATPSANAGANGNAAGYGGQFPGGGNLRSFGAAGTVTANDDGTLEVKGQDGTETMVKTTGDTTVTTSSEGKLSDLKVGDNVLVMGETDGDAVAAQSITDNGDLAITLGGRGGGPGGSATDSSGPEGQMPPDGGEGVPGGTPPNGTFPEGQMPPGGGQGGQGFPGGQGGRPTAGEITKIDGGTITVKTTDGTTVTVTTSDDTTVSVTEEIDVSDIEVGDTITAQGDTADDVVTATTIRVGELGQGFPGGGSFPGGGAGGPGGSGAPGNGQTGGGGNGSTAGDTTTVTGT